ncbi:hypothetical protein CMEL01_10765, partial [Colletotrichum melonis]
VGVSPSALQAQSEPPSSPHVCYFPPRITSQVSSVLNALRKAQVPSYPFPRLLISMLSITARCHWAHRRFPIMG